MGRVLAARGGRGRSALRRATALLLLLAMALTLSACSANTRTGDVEVRGIAKFKMPAFPETGANAVEIFTEMHYQPSYRAQEGPRILPPEDSVPVTGKEIRYGTLEEYAVLSVPGRFGETYAQERAQRLYRINCMMCHGPTLRGEKEEEEAAQAKMLGFWPRSPETGRLIGPAPADLLSDLTKGSTDGELFAFVSNGGRQGLAAIERGRRSASPMPEFRFLLSEEERWHLVTYLRSQQQAQ